MELAWLHRIGYDQRSLISGDLFATFAILPFFCYQPAKRQAQVLEGKPRYEGIMATQ